MVVHVLDPVALPPDAPQRVLVAGASGAGKTTVAGKLATMLGLPHVELDTLYYEQNWSVRSDFVADVAEVAARPRWVTEWHYPRVNGLLAERADLMVWLDYSTTVTMTSLLLRTLLRALHREVLWKGNQERPLRSLWRDPESILRYGWATRHETSEQLTRLPGRIELNLLRFRRPADLSDWLLRQAAVDGEVARARFRAL